MKGKWTFKVEYNKDGTVKRFKARWVGCGYSQIAGVDFGETYASTLGSASMRSLLAAAAALDLEIEEGDTIKAFSSVSIGAHELYVEMPHRFETKGMVACKLLMALEGTKQAAALYFAASAKCISGLGYTRSMVEPNIYFKTVNGTDIKVAVYVDNILSFYPKTTAGKQLNEEFWVGFGKTFNVQRRGSPRLFMGIELSRNRNEGTLTITQTDCIKKAVATLPHHYHHKDILISSAHHWNRCVHAHCLCR